MGREIAATYVITGPDGARAVLNDSSDTDFVGYLTDLSGFDSPEIRHSAGDVPSGDGARQGANYMGGRPITLDGIFPDAGATLRNARIEKLDRATMALRADGTIKWTETGGVERMIEFRRQAPFRATGARDKRFSLALFSARPIIVASALSGTDDPTPPLSAACTNLGNAKTWALITLFGATTSPVTITNVTTGEIVKLNAALSGPTDTRAINTEPGRRSIVSATGADKYNELDFLATTWIGLAPGANTITSDKGSRLLVQWRHGWSS